MSDIRSVDPQIVNSTVGFEIRLEINMNITVGIAIVVNQN